MEEREDSFSFFSSDLLITIFICEVQNYDQSYNVIVRVSYNSLIYLFNHNPQNRTEWVPMSSSKNDFA